MRKMWKGRGASCFFLNDSYESHGFIRQGIPHESDMFTIFSTPSYSGEIRNEIK